MSYPMILAYHPRISVKNTEKLDYYITGNLNEFMLDEDVLKSLHVSYPKLRWVDLVAALMVKKVTVPEGELWLVDSNDVPLSQLCKAR